MACEVQILTNVYNPETKKMETKPVVIGIVDESENITMDRVVELISTLPSVSDPANQTALGDRSTLAANIIQAKRQNLTEKMIGEHQFIGNITVSELLSKYPNLGEIYKIDPSLYDNYTIIYTSQFKINNINYNGRVMTSDGREMFIIKDYQGALNFVKYLQAKEMADKAFSDESNIPESLTPYLSDMGAIAKRYHKSMQQLVEDYLNNRDTFAPFVSGTKVITPRQILGKVAATLVDGYNFDDNMTDLEIGLSSIRAKAGNSFDWKLPKAGFYNLLTTYFPDFGKAWSLDNFRNMTAKELNDLFTGPNGYFIGHPKLCRATVGDVTQGSKIILQPAEETVTKTGKVKHEELKNAWDNIRSQAATAGIELAENFSEYSKQEPEAMADLFNNVKFQYQGVDGQPHTVTAKVLKDKNDRKRVEYSYEYPVKKEPKVKESASYITLKFPYSSIGEIYNFGYETQSIFSPVNEGDVVSGMYNGMYVYKAAILTKRGIQPVYAISRSIISPNSYMSTYPTLEAALHGINSKNTKDKIASNSLISIKQTNGDIPRQAMIEMDNVQEGQILSTLDITLPRININKMPVSVRTLLNLTVPEFQQQLANIPGIEKLNTPEKAAAFVVLMTNILTSSDFKAAESGKTTGPLVGVLQNNAYAERVNAIIDTIDKAPLRNYYIEKLSISKIEKGNVHKIATLKLLEDGGTSVDLTGTKIGDKQVSAFIGQAMTDAIQFFKDQYNVAVNSKTSSELEAFSKEHNLGLEDKIDGIKAFIYDGQIYINTTNAKISDLFHEISHLFLGVLKANYPEGYQQILDEYQQKSTFARKVRWIDKAYQGFAAQDKTEEAVVDMIADEMFKDKEISVTFNKARFTEIMQDIINKIDGFKQDMSDNGLGFDGFMKKLMEDNAATLKQQRIVTNFIKSKLGKEITEKCS